MKILKTLLLATTVLSGIAVKAQTAGELVDKYIAALGGKEKIAGIKTLYTEGSVQIMGNEAPSITTIVNGTGLKNEMDFNGSKIINCYTKDGGWTLNPFQGQATAEPLPAELAKRGKSQLDIGGPLYNYAAKGNKVELVGKEDVEKVKNAYKLKVVTPDSLTTVMYLDPTTYYLIKTVNTISVQGQEIEVSSVFSDFKKTDYGFTVPYSTELNLPTGMTLVIVTKKVEINKAVDPKIFEMPK